MAGSGIIVDKEQDNQSGKGGGNVLIAFFSWGGNTKGIAEQIQSQTGADLFEIELVHPYSEDYDTVLDKAQRDQNEQARTEIKNHVENMGQYDTVILGYPNGWYSCPMALLSFFDENDLSGKQVYLFCSHGTGGLVGSVKDISAAIPDAKISDNVFDVYEEDAASAKNEIVEWVKATKES